RRSPGAQDHAASGSSPQPAFEPALGNPAHGNCSLRSGAADPIPRAASPGGYAQFPGHCRGRAGRPAGCQLMSRLLAILMAVITAVLIAAGVEPAREKEKTTSPEGTVTAFYDRVRADDYPGAYALIAPSSNVDFQTLHRDIAGRDGSLKTLSQL